MSPEGWLIGLACVACGLLACGWVVFALNYGS